jgi:hypothetical protein
MRECALAVRDAVRLLKRCDDVADLPGEHVRFNERRRHHLALDPEDRDGQTLASDELHHGGVSVTPLERDLSSFVADRTGSLSVHTETPYPLAPHLR